MNDLIGSINIKDINASQLYNQYTYGEKCIQSIIINKSEYFHCIYLNSIINEKDIFITKISLLNSKKDFSLKIGGFEMDIINDNILNINLPLNLLVYHEISLFIHNKQTEIINIEYIKYHNIFNINKIIVYLNDNYFKGKWILISGFIFKIHKTIPLTLSEYKYEYETPDNKEHVIQKYWEYLYPLYDTNNTNNINDKEENIILI